MGLVGWADAPSSEENDTNPQGGLDDIKATGETGDAACDVVDQADEEHVAITECAAEEINQGLSGNLLEEAVSDEATVSPNDVQMNELVVEDAPEGLQNELFEAIGHLKLRDDPSKNSCDISKIELHEVKFVLDHAARTESLDYYKLARAVHQVKHQLLNAEALPDSIESPNLDELIGYIEEQYRSSINDE